MMDLVKTMQPVSDPRQSVLIIDDNPADAERLRRYIAQYGPSISTIILENTSQVAKILAEHAISVVFIDQYIGASTGTRVIKSQKKRFPKIPFILLTGFGDEQVACEAIRAGAMDYLRKNSLNAARVKSILINITSHWLKDKTISDQNTKLSQQAAIIDATSDAVIYTNAGGEIIFVNSAAQGMLALPSAEKQPSLTLQDICSETYTALIKTCILRTLQSGNTWSGDIALQSGVAGDPPLPVSVVAFPLKNNAGGVTAYAAIMRDITEKQQREAALYHAANHDALTGLANRSMIMTTLAHSIKRAERDRHTFALLFLDLDHFKGINDTLGHHMGDILLKGIARRLQSTARGGDHIGRIGGDEFVIIMDVEQNSDAAQLAKRILTLMKEPMVIGSETIYVSSSIGIALFPQCGRQPDVLLSKADMAMYRAKSSGRNRFLFYTEDLLLAARRQEEGKQNLCQKLHRNDFFMVHQPITDRTGATIGWEALVRCQHDGHRVMQPDEFISVAEESGLMVELGHWIIKQALGHFHQLTKMLGNDVLPTLSINISVFQLQDRELIPLLQTQLAKYQLRPEQITLEITESALIEHSRHEHHTIELLSDAGFTIAIDDFGTGYASFRHLQQLPISMVKIDRTFVTGVDQDKVKAALVDAIITMTQALQLTTVVEGIETEQEHKFFMKRKCDRFQGYLFARPKTLESMLE